MADERGRDRSGRRGTELRTAISLVGSAAADLGEGGQPVVRVLPDGRLWLTDQQLAVTAADVYQAARGLIAAQLRGMAGESTEQLAAVVGSWLVSLQVNEAMLALDTGPIPGTGVQQDDAA